MDGATAENGLEAVVFGRIVAARDHDCSGCLQVLGRVVEQRRRHGADIGDVASGGEQALEERVMQAIRTEPAVAAEIDVAAAVFLKERTEAAPEFHNVGTLQVYVGNAANVVLAEDVRIEHK